MLKVRDMKLYSRQMKRESTYKTMTLDKKIKEKSLKGKKKISTLLKRITFQENNSH